MVVIAKGIPRGCQGLFTPVSLGYPLSVFNKNSTFKIENQTAQAKANIEQNSSKRHAKRRVWFGNDGECDEGGNQQGKQNNSWLCGMGWIWCHVMLCMHVVDSRRCPVHCEHENSGAESSAEDTKRWSKRTEGQRCGQIWCRSRVSCLVCHACLSSALPPSRKVFNLSFFFLYPFEIFSLLRKSWFLEKIYNYPGR